MQRPLSSHYVHMLQNTAEFYQNLNLQQNLQLTLYVHKFDRATLRALARLRHQRSQRRNVLMNRDFFLPAVTLCIWDKEQSWYQSVLYLTIERRLHSLRSVPPECRLLLLLSLSLSCRTSAKPCSEWCFPPFLNYSPQQVTTVIRVNSWQRGKCLSKAGHTVTQCKPNYRKLTVKALKTLIILADHRLCPNFDTCFGSLCSILYFKST